MRKIGLLMMPLMAVSLLASCNNGGGDKPGPEKEQITITVDAGDGNISGLKKVTYIVNKGDKLVPYLRFLTPTKKDSVFGYFSIKGSDKVIDYEDTVTENIEINSNYFPEQIGDLDQEYLTWDLIKAAAVTNNNPNSCFKIGATKTVKVNDLDHKVRIIGFSQDKDKDGNDIGITFEFADLISDSNGCSIATQWNDTNDSSTANHNYLDSSVRMALVGEKQDKGHILWAQKGNDHWSNESGGYYTNKSVLEMLPEELTGVLIAPQKTVLCFKNDPNDIEDWEEKEIVNENNEYDKLFLLSPEEMGSNDTREGAYAYYQEEDDAKLKSLRIKKQVNRVAYSSASLIENGSGQTYEGTVQNCAGIYITNYGGYSFLRSPYIHDSSQANAIRVDGSLYIDAVCGCALAVAPAFCI